MNRKSSGIRLQLLGFLFLIGLGLPALTQASPCSDLAVAHQLKDPVLDARVAALLQSHAISRLEQEFYRRDIRLNFELDGNEDIERNVVGAGYPIQRRVLRRLLSLAFPDATFADARVSELLDGSRTTVQFKLLDHALQDDEFALGIREPRNPTEVEMTRMKLGNPEVYDYSRDQVRSHFGFSQEAKIVSIYTSNSGIAEVDRFLSAISDPPDVVILSYSYLAGLDEVKKWFKNSSKYDFVKLSEFKKPTRRSKRGPLIIFNDTRGRLPELYSTSDFAVVIGPNNFFEPIIAHCPTLIYPGNPDRFNYSIPAYIQLAEVAIATQGALILGSDSSPREFKELWERLSKIDRTKMVHPAFSNGLRGGRNGLEKLLDDLLSKIRFQVEASAVRRR
jgi:hypothetical protein